LDGPEISGEVRAGEIVVKNPALALDYPLWRLGVPEEDHPAFVIIVRAIKIRQKINGYHRI
jgi:hypothetical protein